MTTPRREQVDLSVTRYYHCIARCVRRAFLCGHDSYTGKDFEHRKEWVRSRPKSLTSIFAVDICSYAIMSNHLHVGLGVDEERALGWREAEVIERYTTLHPTCKEQLGRCARKGARKALVRLWRSRLCDISWFMRALCEYIARKANREDKVSGRFWEGRFKTQALVDERGLLACMVYIDLNPLRAGMASNPADSDFTSIQERVECRAKNISQHRAQRSPSGLAPFLGQSSELECCRPPLPISMSDYEKLVRWTAGLIDECEADSVHDYDMEAMAVLVSQGTSPIGWIQAQCGHALRTATVVGSLAAVEACAKVRGKRSVRGVGLARKLAA